MRITPIFVLDDDCIESADGIHSFVFDKEYSKSKIDEFTRLYTLWSKTDYVISYLTKNIEYLKSPFFSGRSIDDLRKQISNEVNELYDSIYSYPEDGSVNLQMIFKPLSESDNYKSRNIPVLQLTKGLVERHITKIPLVRLYAIRISENCFIITGGAIKLTKKMFDHPDTKLEFEKLESCKNFLRKNGIEIDDDLIYYYEQEC